MAKSLPQVFLTTLCCFDFMFYSCTPGPAVVSNEKVFFDLKGFVNAQSEMLQAEKTALSKTVTFNAKTESKIFSASEINWKNEFSAFSDADINKPSWRDSYEIRSAMHGDDSSVTYISRDLELPVILIFLNFTKERALDSIYIETSQANPLYNTVKKMSYATGKRISISGTQHTVILGNENYSIESLLIKNP